MNWAQSKHKKSLSLTTFTSKHVQWKKRLLPFERSFAVFGVIMQLLTSISTRRVGLMPEERFLLCLHHSKKNLARLTYHSHTNKHTHAPVHTCLYMIIPSIKSKKNITDVHRDVCRIFPELFHGSVIKICKWCDKLHFNSVGDNGGLCRMPWILEGYCQIRLPHIKSLGDMTVCIYMLLISLPLAHPI